VLGALLSHLLAATWQGPRGALPAFARAFPFALSAAAAAACIDPQGDYDAFVARAPAPDAAISGGSDAQVADPCPTVLAGPPSGVFFGACMTTASAGDVTQATYVKLESTIAPSADHTTGELTARITSLVRNPTNISQTVGATTTPPAAPISKDCTYVIEAGTMVIPADSNAAKMDLTLEGTRYRGKLLTSDESCSDLDATITMPVTIDLTKGMNYCVFKRAPPGGAVTLFKLADFECPGAPPPM
jgi:hypothetical protein